MSPQFADINPPQRMLMGPGPANANPRVLRAMAADLIGQFDPEFTDYMNETMALYRHVFCTKNEHTFVVNGTARAGTEAAMVSMIAPGDRVMLLNFGRFGLLLREILERIGAQIHVVEAPWGEVVPLERIRAAALEFQPQFIASVHGDTSTTMAQPLDGIRPIADEVGAMVIIDACATISGMPFETDAWGVDVVNTGLQKCLGGPSGCAPITVSPRAGDLIFSRRHTEAGIAPGDLQQGPGPRIASNYLDLAMVMDYWSPRRLNHHTESASMLYAARECARVALEEGLPARFERHRLAGAAVTAGARALGLTVYGDDRYRMTNVTAMYIPDGVDGERVRARMRTEFEIEIGTSFGPLHGKVWRIGAMGENARMHKVFLTLGALEVVLRAEGFACTPGAGVGAAREVYGL